MTINKNLFVMPALLLACSSALHAQAQVSDVAVTTGSAAPVLPTSAVGATFSLPTSLPGAAGPVLLPLPTSTVTVTGPAAPTVTSTVTVPPELVPVVTPPTPSTLPTTLPTTALPSTSSALPHAPRPSQVRGIWVDAFGPGLKTPQQVQQMVDDAQRLGINTLFVQTIRRADCLCNLSSVPRAADKDLTPGFDPLAAVITLAHAKNIRVIAWVSVTGAGSNNAPNPSSLHVLKLHGPAAGMASWVNRRADGTYLEGSDIWLDAGIPAASDFMAQSILSLVKNYNIDGIQFDRIRYPDGGNWGYSAQALTRYRAETGAVGVPLATDARWTAWKRSQITALVRRVALESRFLKPQLWITAATITYGAPPTDLTGFVKSRTYTDVVQDWPTWTASGLLDLNVLMNYKQDLVPNHIQWFDGWNAFALSVAGDSEVAAGTALYLNSPQVSREQYVRATAMGLGWVGYAYRTPTLDVYKNGMSQVQGFEQLRKALTASEVVVASGTVPVPATQPASSQSASQQPVATTTVPAATTPSKVLPTPVPTSARPPTTFQVGPWTATPPQRYGLMGHIRGPALLGGRTVNIYSAAGTLLATSLTDGNGYYGFASLPAGLVEVRIEGQHWQQNLLRPGVVRIPDMLLKDAPVAPVQPIPVSVLGVSSALVPKVSAPKASTPKASVPKVTVPKITAPKAATPKALAPKTPVPKAVIKPVGKLAAAQAALKAALQKAAARAKALKKP